MRPPGRLGHLGPLQPRRRPRRQPALPYQAVTCTARGSVQLDAPPPHVREDGRGDPGGVSDQLPSSHGPSARPSINDDLVEVTQPDPAPEDVPRSTGAEGIEGRKLLLGHRGDGWWPESHGGLGGREVGSP
jgi:hypothetical protein